MKIICYIYIILQVVNMIVLIREIRKEFKFLKERINDLWNEEGIK